MPDNEGIIDVSNPKSYRIHPQLGLRWKKDNSPAPTNSLMNGPFIKFSHTLQQAWWCEDTGEILWMDIPRED